MDSYDHNPSELEMGGGPVKRTRNGDKESGGPDRDSAWVEKNEEDEKDLSVEKLFESKKVPPWWEQITFRGMFVSMLMGIMFSIIVMKLNLTTGIIPSLNVSAGLIGFFFMRTWTKMLDKVGLLKTPFTRQENTVIQTCVVACYGIAFSGTSQLLEFIDFFVMICCDLGYGYHFQDRVIFLMGHSLNGQFLIINHF